MRREEQQQNFTFAVSAAQAESENISSNAILRILVFQKHKPT
jgi:hypothetical protein